MIYSLKFKLVFVGVFFFLCLLNGCKKDNPLDKNLKKAAHIKLIRGNNQKGDYNTFLRDSLVVMVTDHENKPVYHAPVYFDIKNGHGKVKAPYVWSDSSGLAYVKLCMPCVGVDLKIVAYLIDDNANNIDSVSFSATSIKPLKWGKACGIEYDVTTLKEYNKKYYALSQQKLYISSDGGINWQIFPNLPEGYIYDVQFNSKGWMYLLTRDHGIYYTTNEGSSWINLSNGLGNTSTPLSFLVEDSVMYASYGYSGIYRSRDNGQSWKKLFINGTYSEQFTFIKRHPSGSLYVFDRWDHLWTSSGNGDTWKKIDLDYKYLGSEVSSFVIGSNGLLYIGSSDVTLSIITPDTYSGNAYNISNSTYSHTVNNIVVKDDKVYFTILGSDFPGIYSSDGWKRIENGFYKSIGSLLLKSDGKFLVGGYYDSGGVYWE